VYQVTVINNGIKFWLKKTTWAFSAERGDRFETIQNAIEAITKAQKFMAPRIKKNIKIEEV
jgi:hypothetical protein